LRERRFVRMIEKKDPSLTEEMKKKEIFRGLTPKM